MDLVVNMWGFWDYIRHIRVNKKTQIHKDEQLKGDRDSPEREEKCLQTSEKRELQRC